MQKAGRSAEGPSGYCVDWTGSSGSKEPDDAGSTTLFREQLFSICCVLSAGRDPQPQLLLRGMRPQVREACTGPPGKGEGASSPGREPAGPTGSWAGGHMAAP